MINEMIVGIDPDTKASGVAIFLNKKLDKLTLLSLYDVFKLIKEQPNVHVCISAGWLNKVVNFQNRSSSTEVRERISEKIGANHEIGRQIRDFCISNKISYTLVRPRYAKINAKVFLALTGWSGKTNQDERDAAMAAIFFMEKEYLKSLEN